MRAAVLEGPRDVQVLTVPDATLPGPDGALVTVERTAICGSDLHLYHDAPTGTGIHLGHEAIGTVAAVGDRVRLLRPGDRVLVSGVVGIAVDDQHHDEPSSPGSSGSNNVVRRRKWA